MNCKQVEELLPLYVSRDLDDCREHLIAAHVQGCAQCAAVADEYRATRQLLHEFTPAAFHEDVYDAIRQGVWQKIEERSAAPSMSEVVAGWFRPRLAWAVASVLLIAVLALGIFLITNRNSARQEVAGGSPKVDKNATNETIGGQAQRDTLTASPSPMREGIEGQRQVHIRRPEHGRDRRVAPDRVNSLVATAPDALSPAAGSPELNNSAAPDSSSVRDPERPLRMEIQTKDPNIRIIWFTHQDTKRVSPNSKGI